MVRAKRIGQSCHRFDLQRRARIDMVDRDAKDAGTDRPACGLPSSSFQVGDAQEAAHVRPEARRIEITGDQQRPGDLHQGQSGADEFERMEVVEIWFGRVDAGDVDLTSGDRHLAEDEAVRKDVAQRADNRAVDRHLGQHQLVAVLDEDAAADAIGVSPRQFIHMHPQRCRFHDVDDLGA